MEANSSPAQLRQLGGNPQNSITDYTPRWVSSVAAQFEQFANVMAKDMRTRLEQGGKGMFTDLNSCHYTAPRNLATFESLYDRLTGIERDAGIYRLAEETVKAQYTSKENQMSLCT